MLSQGGEKGDFGPFLIYNVIKELTLLAHASVSRLNRQPTGSLACQPTRSRLNQYSRYAIFSSWSSKKTFPCRLVNESFECEKARGYIICWLAHYLELDKSQCAVKLEKEAWTSSNDDDKGDRSTKASSVSQQVQLKFSLNLFLSFFREHWKSEEYNFSLTGGIHLLLINVGVFLLISFNAYWNPFYVIIQQLSTLEHTSPIIRKIFTTPISFVISLSRCWIFDRNAHSRYISSFRNVWPPTSKSIFPVSSSLALFTCTRKSYEFPQYCLN